MSKSSVIRAIPSKVINLIKTHKVLTLIVTVAILVSIAVIGVTAANTNEAQTAAAPTTKPKSTGEVRSASDTTPDDNTNAASANTTDSTKPSTANANASPTPPKATTSPATTTNKPAGTSPTPIPVPTPTPTNPPAANATISVGSPSCVGGKEYVPYSYVINLYGRHGGGTLATTWEWRYVPALPPTDNSPTLPYLSITNLPPHIGAVSDSPPLYYGFGTIGLGSYQARLHVLSPDIYSNWVTIPDYNGC